MSVQKKDVMDLLAELNQIDFSCPTQSGLFASTKIKRYFEANEKSLLEMNQRVISILRELIEENTRLASRIAMLEQGKNNIEIFEQRVSDIEKREEWTRERFEGQDQKFVSVEEFQNWARSGFEGHDERFGGIEEREEWARKRFEGQDQKFISVEEFQNWTRSRFEGHDERLEGIEGREEWTRKRFEGQACRFEGIEEREEWTRERFGEAFDRLYRNDEIINCSIRNQRLVLPSIQEENMEFHQIMLNNRIFWMGAYSDATDNISTAVKEKRLSCGNTDLLNLFGKEGTFIDIGANIGAFSLGFASQGWRGIAFEAGSKNCELLSKSIEKNNFDICLVNKAISSESGYLFFSEEGPWGTVVKEKNIECNVNKVEALALDDYIADAKMFLKRINLVKMDIEGSEVAAIRGMKKFLEVFQYPCLYIEVNIYTLSLQGETHLSLYEELKRLGYQAYIYENGKLYEFDVAEFPLEYCEDRLFIHQSHIHEFKICGYKRKANEEISCGISLHLEKLIELENDSVGRVTANHNYVCGLLEFYPNLINERVKEQLKRICIAKKEDTYLMDSLKWFTNV